MDSPCPPHRTFAARAAYFGDRMCSFCDHRNPGDAKFCNACASPLHLKPCKQCDAVNDQTATNCYKCGAPCPVLFSTPCATPALPSAASTAASATTDDAVVAASVTQRRFATSALPAGRLRPGQFAAAVIATILIVGAYDAYRINVATPGAIGDASQPVVAANNHETAATHAVPPALEWKPAEPETTAAPPASIPVTNTETPKLASVSQPPASVPVNKRASAHQSPVPAPVTKRASARQRSERKAPASARPPVASNGAAARARSQDMQTSKASGPDRWQVMHVSLARCGGDLFARMVCDQRVRRHFCEGHWGAAPECPSGVVNEHGQ
jgi:ribosomal protein L40E